MFSRDILASVLMLFACAAPVLNQERPQSGTVTRDDGAGLFTPERMEEARRQGQRLANPNFITLRIVSATSDEAVLTYETTRESPGRYRFQLHLTNTSAEPIGISEFDPYYQNRLELRRYGQIVPYREQIARRVDEGRPFSIRARGFRLEPNIMQSVDTIDLDVWYGALEPGMYELIIRHRFGPGENWIESAPTVFEVGL